MSRLSKASEWSLFVVKVCGLLIATAIVVILVGLQMMRQRATNWLKRTARRFQKRPTECDNCGSTLFHEEDEYGKCVRYVCGECGTVHPPEW